MSLITWLNPFDIKKLARKSRLRLHGPLVKAIPNKSGWFPLDFVGHRYPPSLIHVHLALVLLRTNLLKIRPSAARRDCRDWRSTRGWLHNPHHNWGGYPTSALFTLASRCNPIFPPEISTKAFWFLYLRPTNLHHWNIRMFSKILIQVCRSRFPPHPHDKTNIDRQIETIYFLKALKRAVIWPLVVSTHAYICTPA